MPETFTHARNLCRIFGWSQFVPSWRDQQQRVNVFAVEAPNGDVHSTLQVLCITVDASTVRTDKRSDEM